MSGISVTGGAGSTAARFEDMLALAGLMTHNAGEIEHTVTSLRHFAQGGEVGVGLDFLTHNEMLQALDDVVTVSAHGLDAATKLRTTAARLIGAVAWYRIIDTDQSSGFWDSLVNLPGAGLKATFEFVTTHSVGKAFNTLITSDPALGDDVINFLPVVLPGIDAAAPVYPDGHPSVTALGPEENPDALTQPHNLHDLLAQLAIRNDGGSGEISVAFTYGGDGTRHVIVDIPGTKSWDPFPTSDVTSLSTDFRSVKDAQTAYERGVLDAMQQAGVSPTDDVMLVGHSEGGMVAVTAAREALKSKRFNVTHVVTAGSPIGTDVASLPRKVQVLALENRSDLIPELDGRKNPDLGNVTTVTGDVNHGTVADNHSLENSYEHIADQADASHNASIREFVDSASGYFTGCGQNVHRFVIHRHY